LNSFLLFGRERRKSLPNLKLGIKSGIEHMSHFNQGGAGRAKKYKVMFAYAVSAIGFRTRCVKAQDAFNTHHHS
jgi:hypothetical protein